MKEWFSFSILQHSQVDEVFIVTDTSQRVAVMKNIWVSLKLEMVFSELQTTETKRHALHHTMSTCCNKNLAASFLKSQVPEVDKL